MKELPRRAIQMFLDKDLHLLRVDVNERAITHQLACCLKALINDYDVDCEYNRNQRMIKMLLSHGFQGQHVAPDIIIHRRGFDDKQLVIEAKKESSSQAAKDDDRRKLRAFVDELGYQLAAFIVIRTGEENPGIDEPEWFER